MLILVAILLKPRGAILKNPLLLNTMPRANVKWPSKYQPSSPKQKPINNILVGVNKARLRCKVIYGQWFTSTRRKYILEFCYTKNRLTSPPGRPELSIDSFVFDKNKKKKRLCLYILDALSWINAIDENQIRIFTITENHQPPEMRLSSDDVGCACALNKMLGKDRHPHSLSSFSDDA